jgi:hypothetical protein
MAMTPPRWSQGSLTHGAVTQAGEMRDEATKKVLMAYESGTSLAGL